MLSLMYLFNDFIMGQLGIMRHKLDPFAHEARAHFYVVMEIEAIALTPTDQSENEVTLLQVLV